MLLGALALATVAAVAWKPVHLAWCRHLIDSNEEWTQTRGLDRLGHVHIDKGAGRQEVERVLASAGLVMTHSPEQSYGTMDRYVIGFADPARPRFMFWALVQMEDGRFVGISTCH
ncbi:MAG TPA: hypothetical protein PK280_16135 [Planctomycetota bacterium]|nr:hypothetical protein [Planctomycetota bacterium]